MFCFIRENLVFKNASLTLTPVVPMKIQNVLKNSVFEIKFWYLPNFINHDSKIFSIFFRKIENVFSKNLIVYVYSTVYGQTFRCTVGLIFDKSKIRETSFVEGSLKMLSSKFGDNWARIVGGDRFYKFYRFWKKPEWLTS